MVILNIYLILLDGYDFKITSTYDETNKMVKGINDIGEESISIQWT